MEHKKVNIKSILLLIGAGVLAFSLGVGIMSLLNNHKDTSNKITNSSSYIESSEKAVKEKKIPDLTGEYVSNEHTDAVVKKLGNNEWRIDYKTASIMVYGIFETEWKEDAEGFIAKGTMYKDDEKYEFKYLIKVVSATNNDSEDAVLIEFTDGIPSHKMTFKNKQADILKLDSAETNVSNNSKQEHNTAKRASLNIEAVSENSKITGKNIADVDIETMFSHNETLWARAVMTYIEENIDNIETKFTFNIGDSEVTWNNLKTLVEFRLGTHEWYQNEGNKKQFAEHPESYEEMTSSYKGALNSKGFSMPMPQAGGGVAISDNGKSVDLIYIGGAGPNPDHYMTSYSYEDINKFFETYTGDLVNISVQ